MADNPTLWLILLLACEIFESWWQHAPTMGEILAKAERYYRQNIFLFFLMHPSFWLVLYIYTVHRFHGTLLGFIVAVKAADIALKIHLLRLKEARRLDEELLAVLSMPLAPWLPWLNVLFYPVAMALALGRM